MIICLEAGANDSNDLHMVQLMPLLPFISCLVKIPKGFLAFWCQLTQLSWKKAINECCSQLVVLAGTC